ncbi:hypothetical protein F503_06140 [Ophiostoma piceae UAMH 11346]|uniref:Uncharacterized protein n=1 Tax=Ophiostoma piceae (strain UAMH 11346) TaxID=1262450 RepID=S3BRY6_OPHP1|nr:hypothetical protein F503_06140 [Ophiostoma piceae UAMH 11346]
MSSSTSATASLKEVKDKVTELSPEIIYSASMWTPEQAAEMQAVARKVKPEIKTHAIPQGLQVLEGLDAIVAHLTKALPMLL